MLGDDLKHSLGGGQDLGPSPFGQGGVERLDLRARGFLTGLDVATGGGKRGSRRFAGQSFRAVELIVSPAEFASTSLVKGVLPGLGHFPGSPERRAADLVFRKFLDPLGHPSGLTGVEVGPDFRGQPFGQREPGRSQDIGRSAQTFGDPKVVNGSGQVVGLASPGRSGDQLHRQLVSKLDGVVVVGDLGPGGQGQRFVETAGASRLVRLPQCYPPLSQHG